MSLAEHQIISRQTFVPMSSSMIIVNGSREVEKLCA